MGIKRTRTPLCLGVLLLLNIVVVHGNVDVKEGQVGSPEAAESDDITKSAHPPIEIDLIRYPTEGGHDAQDSVIGSHKEYASIDDVIAKQERGENDAPVPGDANDETDMTRLDEGGGQGHSGSTNGDEGMEDDGSSTENTEHNNLSALKDTYEEIINLWHDTLSYVSDTKSYGQDTQEKRKEDEPSLGTNELGHYALSDEEPLTNAVNEIEMGDRIDSGKEKGDEKNEGETDLEKDIIDIDDSSDKVYTNEAPAMTIYIKTKTSKRGHHHGKGKSSSSFDADKKINHGGKKHKHHKHHGKHHKGGHEKGKKGGNDYNGIDNTHYKKSEVEHFEDDAAMQADRPRRQLWFPWWGRDDTSPSTSTGTPERRTVVTEDNNYGERGDEDDDGWDDYDDDDFTTVSLHPSDTTRPFLNVTNGRSLGGGGGYTQRKPPTGYNIIDRDGIFEDDEREDPLHQDDDDGSAGLTDPGGVVGEDGSPEWIDPRYVPESDFRSGAALKLSDHYGRCDKCMMTINHTSSQCPFYSSLALEYEKWSREYINILRYGCSGPGVVDRGRCCHNPEGVVQETVDEIIKLTKSLRILMMNQCNKCPVDCTWAEWTSWSSCPYSCTRGDYRIRNRSRIGAGRYEGRDCYGDYFQQEECPVRPKEYGKWLPWSPWSSCSNTCQGVRHRTRKCDVQDTICPSCFDPCVGDTVDFQDCGDNALCCRDREWGLWSPWTDCVVWDKVRARSQRVRWRSCEANRRYPNEPMCATPCLGRDSEYKDDCCTNATWGTWSDWSECDGAMIDLETGNQCGVGCRNRTRECIPGNCGDVTCEGNHEERISCKLEPCCVPPQWTLWGEWGSCSESTGRGLKTRRRYCQPAMSQWRQPTCKRGGCFDQRDDEQTETCEGECLNCRQPYWGDWGTWRTCIPSGRGHIRTRSRTCLNLDPKPECRDTCSGTRDETLPDTNCCRSSAWGSWGDWETCIFTERGFIRRRTRTCINVVDFNSNCRDTCDGPSEDVMAMNERECCRETEGPWGEWGRCDTSVSPPKETRTRYCPRPRPGCTKYLDCVGIDERGCAIQDCIESCQGREEGEWPSSCTEGCTDYIYCCGAGVPVPQVCRFGQKYDSLCRACRPASPTCPDGKYDTYRNSTFIPRRPRSDCPARRRRRNVPTPCSLKDKYS